jgi:ATP-dependent helicase HrpB
MRLPIEDVISDVIAAIAQHGQLVLQAPPGAGKTTRVPVALLQGGAFEGKLIMLEPRRLAARAAAERMADTLGEPVGEQVGYRMRGEAKAGPNTRIEVVTEGILTRMIQTDPSLEGVGAVIFDEFHERSLNADLGLALAHESRMALRPDLKLVVMSATLDAEPVAKMLGAPIITSQGRAFDVEERWLDAPLKKDKKLELACADLIVQAVTEQPEGGVLVFLPGQGEITRVARALEGRLDKSCAVHKLYGTMDCKAQRAAIMPAETGRKIVLATSIAETSLTIEDVRTVVDAGRSRRARFDPASGMSRLVTDHVTRAEATQRAGRAGRVAEGVAYKLWTKGEHGALAAFPPAEIEAADLAGLALELAAWGSSPEDMAFLTPPPQGALAEAHALLTSLGALKSGRITDHGRALLLLPVHPRLAHMVARAGKGAAPIAALLSGRDILMNGFHGAGADLTLRIRVLSDPKRSNARAVNQSALATARIEAKRLTRLAGPDQGLSAAQMAALAYPDRIGLRRAGQAHRFVLSGGKGAVVSDSDPIGTQRLTVVTDTDGNPRNAKTRQAIAISESELRAIMPEQFVWHPVCEWSRRESRVMAREQLRLGACILEDRAWKNVDVAQMNRAMCDGIRMIGLNLPAAAKRFQARVILARENSESAFPDLSDSTLLGTLEDWLAPYLGSVRTSADWKGFDPLEALRNCLNWEQTQALDQLVPSHFTTPLGNRRPIDYSQADPEIQVRLQELFGVTKHPTVGGKPLKVTVLSPARKPLQTTMDIPGFWAGSYADVRKDMRARYPKHPWPEDPTQAEPTLRTKPRKR